MSITPLQYWLGVLALATVTALFTGKYSTFGAVLASGIAVHLYWEHIRPRRNPPH